MKFYFKENGFEVEMNTVGGEAPAMSEADQQEAWIQAYAKYLDEVIVEPVEYL